MKGVIRMSQLFEKCKQCIDSVYISWDKTKLSTKEKRTIEEYEVWGIVKLALYILNNKEYDQLKQYIYDKHGYDPGGVVTKQLRIHDIKNVGVIR